MKCPRCDTAVLDERERNGVVVDVCPACRGVWLDRGELEKMLSFAKRELEEERSHYGYEREPPSSDRRRGDDREPPSSDRRGPPRGEPPQRYQQGRPPPQSYQQSSSPAQGHHQGHYRKKSWLENLGDIFD